MVRAWGGTATKLSKAFLIILVFINTASSAFFVGQNLSSKYKAWLIEEVVYIITAKERDVFIKLESDIDRDRFIEEFWKQRDPTPETPQNEYRDEHYRRIAFANSNFGHGVPFQGWRTERGRIYIILGPPVDVEKVNSGDTYPLELWYYRGNPAFGQAPFFRLLFCQKGGMGDYTLYNPVGDSPKELVGNPRRSSLGGGDPVDWDEWDKGAYMVMKERLPPDFIDSVFSIIPGATSDRSLRIPSSILLAEIQKYPQKKVNDDYALAILEHRPVVEVSYSEKFIGNRSAVAVLEDSSGAFFVHYALVPDSISIDSYEDKYYASLRTIIRVTDGQGKTLFQQEKSTPIDLRNEELKTIENRSFQLYDSFPLIQGTWTLNLLLQNLVSKEFTTLEKAITVPRTGEMRISPVVLARKVVKSSPAGGLPQPFQICSLQVYPSTSNIFPKKERIWIFFQLGGIPPILLERGVIEFSLFKNNDVLWTTQKNVREIDDLRAIAEELPTDWLAVGKYTVKAVFRDGPGKEILAAQSVFEITAENIPGLWVVAQTVLSSRDPGFRYILGTQYENKGDAHAALEEFRLAYTGRQDSVEYAISYARTLIQTGQADKAKEILLPFADSKNANFILYKTMGDASRAIGELREAAAWFARATSFRGNVVEALNAMGECYLMIGEKDRAAEAFKKSLELNPDQEKIRAILSTIKY